MQYTSQIPFLAVTDLDRSSRFYETIFDIKVVRDQGSCRIYKVTEGAYLGLCRRPGPVNPSGSIQTFVLDDVDQLYERCLDVGALIKSPPRHNPQFEIYHFYVFDPDDHLLEIQRFDTPL